MAIETCIADILVTFHFCTMQDGKIPIMFAAFHKQHELVEILFPLTRPTPSLPDWSIDGVIRGMEHIPFEPRITDPKSKGKEAFAKGDYLHAAELYGQVGA